MFPQSLTIDSFSFYLTSLNKCLLFRLNLLIQFLRSTVFQQLLGQLTLNGRINQLAFQSREVIGILALQIINGVDLGKRFLHTV